MRKKRYPLDKPIALLLLLFITIPSCLHDNFPGEEPGIIVMSLAGVATRAAGDPLFTDDGTINKVRLFVFAGDYLEKNRLFTSGNDDFVNPFVLEVATGSKELYVVANESVTLTPTLETITTKAGLMAVLADEINHPLTPPLLMTGSRTGVSVATLQDPERNSTTVTLTRVAAKINLTLKKDTDADVQITKVSLLNNTGKIPIWEGGTTIASQTYWDYNNTYDVPLGLTNSDLAIGTLYLYENLTGGMKTNATLLKLEALYNNVPTKYRVYVNENVASVVNAGDPSSSVTTPDDHLYSIKRNHEYQVTGVIKNIGEFDGLTLTTEVLPWNHLPATYIFDHVYTITPQPTQSAYTYTVGADGKVSFTFKLTNPIDALWVANFTNPTDFEFDGIYQGVTDNEVTITIKARNTPGEVTRETEFYINAGYGGNWTEVPLFKDSDLVGEGNRIVIRQPANP